MKKYELVLDDKKMLHVAICYRIRALQDFTCIDGFEVHKGDLGGYIEGEHNLSQGGLSWIRDHGSVQGLGLVRDNGLVRDHGLVAHCGEVRGNGIVRDYGGVIENGRVGGDGEVFDNGVVRYQGSVFVGMRVGKGAYIFRPGNVLTVGVAGNQDDLITFYRDIDNEISVTYDDFNGKLDDFLKWVVKEYGDSKHGQAYNQAIRLAKFQIDLG